MQQQFFVPQVIQTSAMDCGPAALKALLEGCGISVSYGRLREACQTSIDGTNIDTLEDVALQLGLDVEQVMLPPDHLFIEQSQALPALLVVRLPNGLTHFVVVWNIFSAWIQIMDPGVGRRWVTRKQLLDQLFIHQMPVPANAWRHWAASPLMQAPLQFRLENLQISTAKITTLTQTALGDATWRSIAALDAAARLVTALVDAGGIEAGDEAAKILEQLFEDNRQSSSADDQTTLIPPAYWLVHPFEEPPESPSKNRLILQGAVLLRVKGLRSDEPTVADSPDSPNHDAISPELLTALQEPPYHPEWEIWQAVRQDGLSPLVLILIGLGTAAVGMTIQTLLLQGVLQVGQIIALLGDSRMIIVRILVFLSALFILNIALTALTQRIGRRLETRLRIAFLEKLPRLGDYYFHSRLVSDMAQRAHELRSLRTFPNEVVRLVRLGFELILTAVGVVWLQPDSGVIALVATGLFAGLTLISRPFLQERSMRLRTHAGALSRFYLDAMQGLIPLRTHNAERAFRREYEGLLIDWMGASRDYSQIAALLQAISTLLYTICSIWVVFDFVSRSGSLQNVFLLLYWTLRLPILSHDFVTRLQNYPMLRNSILRLLEPLSTPEESDGQTHSEEDSLASSPSEHSGGVTIELQNVRVVAGGHTLLSDVNVTLQAGEHLAIVGPSGAGKSTLVGLLLGWHKAVDGLCLIDGQPLDGARVKALRKMTAWVDPAVQLWNRSLSENLVYGNENSETASDLYLEQADLVDLIERLPEGMQTNLGESGGLVSGGEGQQVRLGRALNRPKVRLVILDEPFRGLDREKRRWLLQQARTHWRDATLICITHDMGETSDFDRVMVVENGRIVEDDHPTTLATAPHSRYRDLLDAEHVVRETLWQDGQWRRLWVQNGSTQADDKTR